MFTEGACALKTASKNLKIIFETLPELADYRAPSCTSIKYWAAQVGYYKLMCPKPRRDDWMVMVDASVQMGPNKCVIIAGCSKSSFSAMKDRTLKFQDLEILSLKIVSELNGDVICEMLTELSSEIGKIISICSDRGSEMLNGIKKFQIISPETRQISDTAHRVSNLLKAALEKDPESKWKEFKKLATQARRQMLNSKVAGAAPPNSRSKARYMNLDNIITWAAEILLILDNGKSPENLDIDELRKYIGWLPSFRKNIYYWNRLVSIGKVARNVVRVEGIHSEIADCFEEAIGPIQMGLKELQFADQIAMSLRTFSRGVKSGMYFIGSSESLESIFGKVKYVEREQRAFGFTLILLASMAAIGPLDINTVIEAMATVKRRDVGEWVSKEIGETIQVQRRKIKKFAAQLKDAANKIRKNMGPEVSGDSLEKIA